MIYLKNIFLNKYINKSEYVEEIKIVPATPAPSDESHGVYIHRFSNDIFAKETAKLVASKLGIKITL